MTKFWHLLLVSIISTSFFAEIASAEVEILLRDQFDQPIENAVISIPLESTTKRQKIVVVDQKEKRFVPQVSIVYKGQQVFFPNSDDVRHHVYSFSKAKSFELKLYSGNTAEPLRFDNSGVVVLGCNIHDRMVGYIYVAGAEIAAKTDKAGKAQFAIDAAEFHAQQSTIKIWHPRLGLTPETQKSLDLPQGHSVGRYELSVELQPQTKPERKRGFRSQFY